MPYITQNHRNALDPHIVKLAEEINHISNYEAGLNTQIAWAGLVNYAVTRLALKTLPQIKYWSMALMVGTLICAILEFYRRWMAPYEDKKIQENGDVY